MMLASDLVLIAKGLAASKEFDGEALHRTIVNRAYYAVYLLTRDWIHIQFPDEILKADGKSHERYTNCLKSLQRKNMDLMLSKYARKLDELKSKRTLADYDLTCEVGKVNAEEAIILSESLINELSKLKSKYSKGDDAELA